MLLDETRTDKPQAPSEIFKYVLTLHYITLQSMQFQHVVLVGW